MRKYLLSLLLVCVLFISFCSSVQFNFITAPDKAGSSYNTLRPIDFEFYTGFNISSSLSSYKCSLTGVGDYCAQRITFKSNLSNKNCYIRFENGTLTLSSDCSLNFDHQSLNFKSVNCSSPSTNHCFDYLAFNYDFSQLYPCVSSSYTSEQCQSEYSLVPSSDLISCQSSLSGCQSDYSTCNSNLSGCMINLDNYTSSLNTCSSNLNNCNTSLSSCMSSNCPVSSGNISWSSLFINNIQHLGAPIIDITIPEEFDWDYVSTDEEFTLDIEGYNVDTEYMNGIITTQTTLPNNVDFNNIISSVVPLFVPGIVIIFFLYFVFKFIKKIF